MRVIMDVASGVGASRVNGFGSPALPVGRLTRLAWKICAAVPCMKCDFTCMLSSPEHVRTSCASHVRARFARCIISLAEIMVRRT